MRVAVLLALLLASVSGCGHVIAKDHEEAEGPDVRVRVAPASERTLAERVTGLGRCEAIHGHYAALTAAAEGRVVELLKRQGDAVMPGDAIVQLDATIAQKSLVEKQRAVEVQKLAIDQADLALKKAQLAVNHLKPLRQRGEITEIAMSDAESAFQQAELQLRTAKVQCRAAEAAVDTAEAQLAQLTIRTPIAGVLNALTCHLGQTLSVGAAVGEVLDAGRLQAVVWLPVPDARRLKSGQPAAVRACVSADDAADNDSPGTVLDVGEAADPQTGNLPVRIKIDNGARRLKLAEAVMATIALREEKSLAVPADAVRDTGDETVLVAVRDGKTAVLHPKLGLRDDGWIAVSGIDLKPGEPVVVEGGYGLDNDVKVQVEEEKSGRQTTGSASEPPADRDDRAAKTGPQGKAAESDK